MLADYSSDWLVRHGVQRGIEQHVPPPKAAVVAMAAVLNEP
jgi:hypothetical protein